MFHHIYKLPEELIDIIFLFHDPYIQSKKNVVMQLKWFCYGYNVHKSIIKDTPNFFYKFALQSLKKFEKYIKKSKSI